MCTSKYDHLHSNRTSIFVGANLADGFPGMVKIEILQGGLEMFTTAALILFIANVSWKYANCIFLKISIFSMQSWKRVSTPVTHRALRFQDHYCFHLRYKIFFAKKINFTMSFDVVTFIQSTQIKNFNNIFFLYRNFSVLILSQGN